MQDSEINGILRSAAEERERVFEEEGYFEAVQRAQREAILGVFGVKPPPPPPRLEAAIGGVAGAARDAGTAAPPAACAKKEPGCLQTQSSAARASNSGYMVLWAFPADKGVAKAVDELKRVLKSQGGFQVKSEQAGGGAVRVRARFNAGVFGAQLLSRDLVDDVEFLLSPPFTSAATSTYGTASFRAAASGDGFPFSTSERGLERNRERLLQVRTRLLETSGCDLPLRIVALPQVRKRLFEKSGWVCACADDLNPLAAAKCALTCS